MKDLTVLSNDELLSLYKKINEYINDLEKEKKVVMESGNKDVK